MEKIHIILAEDDPILSRVVVEELENAGYKVTHVKDGEAAVASVGKKNPELLLLDILMPKMNGMEVLENIKANIATRDVPVIMLTVLSSDDDIKKALKLGASDYIVKSQHAVGEIVEKVNEFCKRGSSPKGDISADSSE